MIIQVLLLLYVSSGACDYISNWTCVVLSSQSIPKPNSGITWTKLSCSGYGQESSWLPPFDPEWQAGPMIFNVVSVNLTAPGVDLTGGVASSSAPYSLQDLPSMASNIPNAVAGVNGGYFYRLDTSSFIDGVCILKTTADAKQPVSSDDYNYGVGDSQLIINGTVYSYNCDLVGYEAPTALILNGVHSSIQVLSWGGQLDPTIYKNAITAGPRLVVDTPGTGIEVNIPATDFNINIWEHAANTAVGLITDRNNPQLYETLVMVTADGTDSCDRSDPTCGIESKPMGYFMKDYLGVSSAMGMDQGGSTTCWVKGQPFNGVVSNSDNTNPIPSPRHLFDGLFVLFQ